ncbi:MAG: cardiolipin synthase [Lachnospiraceae bacterium]|nr:cardiolipin synthase [Lachnospiraceae bacterium]
MQSDNSDSGTLLKKGKKGLHHIIFSRTAVIILLLLIQVLILFGVFRFLGQYMVYYFSGGILLSLVMVFYIMNSRADPTVKLSWLLLVLTAPIAGSLLYIYIKTNLGYRALQSRIEKIQQDMAQNQDDCVKLPENLRDTDPVLYRMADYMEKVGGFSAYSNTDVTYFPFGEAKFEEMLRQLSKAESFIFMEYFIVEEGHMWNSILEILKEKAAQGVEVRVMYDGTCAFSTLPYSYPEQLKKMGIQCKMFAPIRPVLSTHYNNRDHRKILVIDGHTAFTGGVNLADEYINRIERFGRWKDTAVMVQGDAVRGFTSMFLQMWNLTEKTIDNKKYLDVPCNSFDTDGYVIPYGDNPMDDELFGEMVYLDIINQAQKYVHIMTPYLILDQQMITALTFAAKRGVDVKLILPHIPDKVYAFALAKSHYKELLDAGVSIYEYTPGFVHAKVFVCDDYRAVVGTINLDYRSLYHHFECAAYLHKVSAISDIEADIQKTLKECKKVDHADVKNEKIKMKVMGFVLKLVAPLM